MLLGAHVLSDQDYESIIQAARTGAEWAWTAIYRDLAPGVLRYLRAHGAREPEDVMGEVFVLVVRNLPGFGGGGREFRAWVFTIARNRLVDEWRHGQRRPVESAPDDVLTGRSPIGDSEDESMRRLADEQVLGVVGRLSRQQRDVLFLRMFAGFTIEETASVLGKTSGSVKSLQSRALAAIRREMSKGAVSL
jgi:RNA polymerase sigma-70 factor (ECF subfamily)